MVSAVLIALGFFSAIWALINLMLGGIGGQDHAERASVHQVGGAIATAIFFGLAWLTW